MKTSFINTPVSRRSRSSGWTAGGRPGPSDGMPVPPPSSYPRLQAAQVPEISRVWLTSLNP